MNQKLPEDVELAFKHFITDFVRKNRQHRMIQFFEKEKNWRKIRNEFHTSSCFEPEKLVDIEPSEQYAECIFLRMKELGATENCLSFLDYLNGHENHFNLADKLSDCVGFIIESILYCPESKVGYFEGGHAKDRYILKSH